MRKCKLESCKSPLPKLKDCTSPHHKAGYCDSDCAYKYAMANRKTWLERSQKAQERKERKKVRQVKERLKTRSELAREAQTAFNAYIRARDEHLPCVSCGRHHQGQYHAGHYRTTKAAPHLRFNCWNVWKQCQPCNEHLSGNLIPYRQELIRRIGQDRVDWIETHNEVRRYSEDYLRRLKRIFAKRARHIKRIRSIKNINHIPLGTKPGKG